MRISRKIKIASVANPTSATFKGICIMAVLTDNRAIRISTENLATLPRTDPWNIRLV